MNDAETTNELLTDEINFSQFFPVLRRWWRLILACAVLTGLAVFAVMGLFPKSYEAEADVLLVRTATTVNFDSKIRTVSNTDPTNTQTGFDQVSLRKALLAIADSSELAQSVFYALQKQLDPSIKDATSLQDYVSVKNDGDTFQIIARAKSPEAAALIANTWTREYIDRANTIYSDSPVSLEVLSGQLASARSDYQIKESALVEDLSNSQVQKLQQQHDEKVRILNTLLAGKTTAIQSVITETQQVQIRLLRDYLSAASDTRSTVFKQQVNARIQKLQDLYTLALKLERLLANAQSLRARVTDSPSATQAGNSLAMTLLESSAFTTWADLPVSLQISLTELGTNSSPAEQLAALDALIKEIQGQQAEIRTRIDEASKALLSDSGYEYLDVPTAAKSSPLGDAIQQRVQALLNLTGLENISSYSSSDTAVVAAVDLLQKDINGLGAQIEVENAKRKDLTRARDLAWDTYTNLASKVAESQVAESTKGTVVRLAAAAVVPDLPRSNNRLIFTLAGVILGLLIGTGLAFFMDASVGGMTDPQQIKSTLDLPTLARVPDWGNVSAEGNLPSPALEPLRSLRYQLLAEKKVSVLMLTGARQGEGVTTLALNLARVTAQTGKKVLLVDANLRNPGLHSALHLELAPGLSDLLNAMPGGVLEWHLITHAVSPNLDVLTAGSPATDTAAVLQQESLDVVLRQAKADYDLVVVDSSALEVGIDAVEVARAVDGVLLVVDARQTNRTDALNAKETLVEAGAPILGVVLDRGGRLHKLSAPRSEKTASPAPSLWAGVRAFLLGVVGPRSS